MSKILKMCLLSVLLTLAAQASLADIYGGPTPVMGLKYSPPPALNSESYGQTISRKLGVGFSNMTLGWLEIPKNVINTMNDSNFALGILGGTAKGILHMGGRVMTGIVDVMSFPVPTQPLTTPQFVWDNFTVETRYNPLKLQP